VCTETYSSFVFFHRQRDGLLLFLQRAVTSEFSASSAFCNQFQAILSVLTLLPAGIAGSMPTSLHSHTSHWQASRGYSYLLVTVTVTLLLLLLCHCYPCKFRAGRTRALVPVSLSFTRSHQYIVLASTS
jgi:hypothetical protein